MTPSTALPQEQRDSPLSEVLVIDLSRALAGPHAAMLLGDLGARVIKVEMPGSGDDARSWGPPFVGAGGATSVTPSDPGVESTYFLSCNRNKESVTLDLRSVDGLGTLKRLLVEADVVIENFRPGVMDRLGLSFDALHALNPRLVILSISGFGHDGPEGSRAGYDQIVQGEAGLMSLTGTAESGPIKVGVPIADLLAGIHGAYGVLAALYERTRTGVGRVVRTSLLSSIVSVHAFQGTKWTVAGEVPPLSGDQHPSICPYGLFHCSDSDVQIAVGNDQMWRAFSKAFDLDQPEWGSNLQRIAARDKVIATINNTFSVLLAEDVLRRLDDAGIPAGRVRTLDEVYSWPQTQSQGLLLDVEHPVLGTITLPGNPLRFDANAYSGGRAHHAPPPTLGQHNESVLQWLADLDQSRGDRD